MEKKFEMVLALAVAVDVQLEMNVEEEMEIEQVVQKDVKSAASVQDGLVWK